MRDPISNQETPDYMVLKRLTENAEIRRYASSRWVCCSMNGKAKNMNYNNSSMFYPLFNYISGQNSKSEQIKMTTPVTTVYRNHTDSLVSSESNCQMSMRFYLPSNFQRNTPLPMGDIYLEDEKELIVATIRFGGFATMNDYLDQRNKLINLLGNDAQYYDCVNMITVGYDSPFVQSGRRNEVWLKRV